MADEVKKYIAVEAGDKLQEGQVAICEVDPLHPYVAPAPGSNKTGENQAYIVKGNPKFNKGWVGRTVRVQTAIARGYLREIPDPAKEGLKPPKEAPPTPTSEEVKARRDNKTVVPTLEELELKEQLEKAEAEKAELQAKIAKMEADAESAKKVGDKAAEKAAKEAAEKAAKDAAAQNS